MPANALPPAQADRHESDSTDDSPPVRLHDPLVRARSTGPAAVSLHLLTPTRGAPHPGFFLYQRSALIGRRRYCDVVLPDKTVSAEHVSLNWDGHSLLLRDLGSRNGTSINGSAVHSATLDDGDMLDIGIYRLRVQLAPHVSATPEPATALLEILNGAQRGQQLSLEMANTRIESGSAAAVVSRRSRGYFLMHLEGGQPPRINGRAVVQRAMPLHHGDMIKLERTRFRFCLPD